jgi:hypothetical protein
VSCFSSSAIARFYLCSRNKMVIKLKVQWVGHITCRRDEKCISNCGQKTLREEISWETLVKMGG